MAALKQCAYESFQGGTEVDDMEMEEKVKGAHLRGTKYTVSQDGLCPRCGNSNRLYVILDKLFPLGDMPEILHTLIAKGRAILWSSQEKEGYKDPPTFLCRGFCPSDPLGAGFNVDWNNVSVNEILESLDRPTQAFVSSPQASHSQGKESSQDESSDNPYLVLDDFQGNESEVERNPSHTSVIQSSSDKEDENDQEEEEEEEDDDDDDDDLDEEELIKQMLAKEQQKLSQEDNDDDDDVDKNVSEAPTVSEKFSELSTSSSNEIISSSATATTSTAQVTASPKTTTPASSTAHPFPVSSTGRCPYCGSTDVKYIIVVSDNTKDTDLPQSLQQLLKSNRAFKMAKGDSEPPSFQCQKCQYGFNLNWSVTNLEVVFGLSPSTTSATTVKAASFSSTATSVYQTPYAPYMPPAAYSPYPQPSVPPPGYPPPVRVPPPVPAAPHLGYPPTYPGYYGSYYPLPAVPPPVGSYPPYAPLGVPPPGIPYARMPPSGTPPVGIPPPGLPPHGVLPPRIPPPGMPPPGISPPGIPPPGIPPPGIPPPRVPLRGYPPPAVPSIPPPAAPAWSNYPQSMHHTPPRFPPPPARGYLPPPVRTPRYPPQQHLRPPRVGAPHTWHPAPAPAPRHAAAAAPTSTVPTQQVATGQQTAGGEISEVAAARFEMVLNQIDLAKARVRHEKEQMKEFQKAVHGSEMPHQQYNAEPNALTDEGQKVPEYEEKPPGDEDTGFGSCVIITDSSAQKKDAETSVTESTAECSVSPSQITPPGISEHTGATAHANDALARDNDALTRDNDTLIHDNDALTRDNAALTREHSDGAINEAVTETAAVAENAVTNTDNDSKKYQTADVAENAVTDTDNDSKKFETADDDVAEPETVETTSRTVPTRRGRSGRSKKQKKLQSPPAAAPTRQTRRSRRSEPTDTDTTEDTDSTAVEEEALPVARKTNKSHMTKSAAEEVERLDIKDDDQEVMQSGVETSDIEMGESSDVLSQSSVVPRTESDSVHEVPSESLPSSSEPETVLDVDRPQRGRQTRGRKRKQGAAVAEPSVRKSRRMAAEEEQLDEDKEAQGEEMLVEKPAVDAQEEDTEMAVRSPTMGRPQRVLAGREVKQIEGESGAMDTSEEVRAEGSDDTDSPTVTPPPEKHQPKMRTNKRQTRKSAQLPQEPEVIPANEITTSQQTETITHEGEASEAEESTSNRRTRRSAPRRVLSETDEVPGNRRRRKSVDLSSQESDNERLQDSVQKQENGTPEDKNKVLDTQQKEKDIKLDTYPQVKEEKASRRTRKSRKSSAANEDDSDTQKVYSSQESVALIPTEEAVGNRQTRSRKSPAIRNVQASETDTSAVEEDEEERTPRTRKLRKSSASNEDTTSEDVHLSVEDTIPEESVSSRRKRRNQSKPAVQESADFSQESVDLAADVEEQASVTPQGKATKKMAPAQSTEAVTKRVTRARQKK